MNFALNMFENAYMSDEANGSVPYLAIENAWHEKKAVLHHRVAPQAQFDNDSRLCGCVSLFGLIIGMTSLLEAVVSVDQHKQSI